MPKWLKVLKVIFGAVIGTIAGGAVGFGVAWLLFAGFDTSKAPSGQQDSAAMGIGFAIIGSTFMGACFGFVVGTILASVLPRRKNQTPQ